MSKSNASPSPATVLETLFDVEREQARRWRGLVWFWLLTLAGAGIGGLVGWSVGAPWLGVCVGVGVAAPVGTFASVAIWAWPALRPIWNWRVEITAVSLLVAGAAWVASVSGSWWWSLLLLVPLGVAVAVPASRRRLVAFVWRQITRHRLQMCFAAFVRATNRVMPGLVPLVLHVQSTPAGERAWVWLRPGLDLADLQERRDKIAVACWARSVQVVAADRFAALVRIDVNRRDPLARLVASPLPADIPAPRQAPTATVEPADGLGLDLVDVPEPPEGAQR